MSGTLAAGMYALFVIATQQNAPAQMRGVVACSKSGNGMTFDLPRDS